MIVMVVIDGGAVGDSAGSDLHKHLTRFRPME